MTTVNTPPCSEAGWGGGRGLGWGEKARTGEVQVQGKIQGKVQGRRQSNGQSKSKNYIRQDKVTGKRRGIGSAKAREMAGGTLITQNSCDTGKRSNDFSNIIILVFNIY